MNDSEEGRSGWRIGIGKIDNSMNRAINNVEASGIARSIAIVAAIVGFIVLLLTAYQIQVDFADRKEEREYRRIDRIEAARDRLLAVSGGNTGKGEALSFLISENVAIDGLDLSCQTRGVWRDPATFDATAVSIHLRMPCTSPPILTGMKIFGSSTEPPNLRTISELNITENRILGASISDTRFEAMELSGTSWEGVDLVNVVMVGNVAGARFKNCRFAFSEIRHIDLRRQKAEGVNLEIYTDTPGLDDTFQNCDISGSRFPAQFWRKPVGPMEGMPMAYAWADTPPRVFSARIGNMADSPEFRATESLGQSVILCAPPVANRKVVPFRDRPILNEGTCAAMPKALAIERYPD